jgi:hypothetical protein
MLPYMMPMRSFSFSDDGFDHKNSEEVHFSLFAEEGEEAGEWLSDE